VRRWTWRLPRGRSRSGSLVIAASAAGGRESGRDGQQHLQGGGALLGDVLEPGRCLRPLAS
jgi:hypothetical protein